MMKLTKHLLMAAILTIGITFSVSAQKNDDKRPPKPPVSIPVEPKNPPRENPPRENPPRDGDRDKRPKKPESYFADVPNGK